MIETNRAEPQRITEAEFESDDLDREDDCRSGMFACITVYVLIHEFVCTCTFSIIPAGVCTCVSSCGCTYLPS